jgi:RND family efflux transporter MFP subunit
MFSQSHLRSHPTIPAILAAVACAMAACSGTKESKPEPIVAVEVAPVKRATIERKVDAEAVLFALDQAAIVPKVSAPVRKFYVNRGSVVHAGELLAVLENRDLEAAAADTKGAYEQAQATYTQTTQASVPEEVQKAELDVKNAKEALDAAQKVYESRKALFEQGAVARNTLDQAEVAFVQARSQHDIASKHLQSVQSVNSREEMKSAAGQLKSAKSKYEGAVAQVGYSEVRSPIDGVVTDRPLYEGEMASAGSPVITVMNVSQVTARAHVPQAQAQQLKVGDPARITVPGADTPINAKVTVVSPALDPNSTTVEVWVQAANPEGTLKPGTTAHLSIIAQKIADAFVIPQSALLTDSDGKTTVMVAGSDGRSHQTEVKTGIRQDGQVQITDGLKEGQQIVAAGAYGLPDNTKIQIESAQPKAGTEQSAAASGKSD